MDAIRRTALIERLRQIPEQAEELLHLSRTVDDPNLAFALRVAATEFMQLRLQIQEELDRHPGHIPHCAIHPLVMFSKDLEIEVRTLMERVQPMLKSRDHLERCWQRIC